jgi:hypothetical protein
MSQSGASQLVISWLDAAAHAGWWPGEQALTNCDLQLAFEHFLQSDACLFRASLALDQNPELPFSLTDLARQQLRQLVVAGVTLRTAWPRTWSSNVERWIGLRYYFSTEANLNANSLVTSLLCSQIGRHGQQLPYWPTLLDAALRRCYLDDNRLLLTPNTTLSVPSEQFASRAKLDCLRVHVDESTSVTDWINRLIKRMDSVSQGEDFDRFLEELSHQLYLSPAVEATGEVHQDLPIQDRISCALSDRLMVLHVRSKGNVASLLHDRLKCDVFPPASVYLATLYGSSVDSNKSEHSINHWLEQGAVGWLVHRPNERSNRQLTGCRHSSLVATEFTQSLCLPLSSLVESIESNTAPTWSYLAHCTRGNVGQFPDESLEHYLDRAWNLGQLVNSHPLSTLERILSDRRILGNSHLTRSTQPCVSFSAVPLPELLSRRQFRAHLGRWDWEPYGLLFRRHVLERLGARPVTYGEEHDYQQLPPHQKPYFQLRGKKDRRTQQDWSCECEWRLLGNLSLSDLPPPAMMLFVATQPQAQQLARRWSWPVIWNDL